MSLRSEVIRIYNELIAGAKKISGLPAAGALTGAELIETVQGGVNVQTTTQDIADLGGGGGTWGSITGTLADQTDLNTALGLKAPLASPTFTASGKTTPVDADEVLIRDSAASNILKLLTWANVKATLKTYFDTLYQSLINSATALVDGASIDLTAIKHTLASSSATRTFTISYTGDDITLEVTLSATSATYTFPATSLCVSEGVASGDNTLALAGVSGDKYIIAIKKIGSAYYVVSKNFGQ